MTALDRVAEALHGARAALHAGQLNLGWGLRSRLTPWGWGQTCLLEGLDLQKTLIRSLSGWWVRVVYSWFFRVKVGWCVLLQAYFN